MIPRMWLLRVLQIWMIFILLLFLAALWVLPAHADTQPADEPPIPTPPTLEESNVLFLPGIEGSRLYDADEKLWEPVDQAVDSVPSILGGIGNERVRKLSLTTDGKSVRDDVHIKEGDIIDSASGTRYYASFIEQMNELKSAGTITDWQPVAYDWRLSLPEIANQDLEQRLRTLAASSKTGKVTLIAHSNGGLVAKALMERLGDEEASKLIDKVILIAVPQGGAPEAIGALLYGLNQGIGAFFNLIPIVSSQTVQALSVNAPMAYHLLPSPAYFSTIQNAPGTFTSWQTIADFLTARTFNSSLITYAKTQHDALDAWPPPEGAEVYEVAGFGVSDTVSGIESYTFPTETYRPFFTSKGDGVVPEASALLMPEGDGVKKYWVNLSNGDFDHGTLLEDGDVLSLIKSIFIGDTGPTHGSISTSEPPPDNSRKLLFFLHSPLTLELANADGNTKIPGLRYGEFGEVKYAIAPAENEYQLTLHGLGSGMFSLDIQEQIGDTIVASTTIANVPVTTSTTASMTIHGSVANTSPLTVDEDGDGTTDITISPLTNEIVSYAPALPAPVAVPTSHFSSGSSVAVIQNATTTKHLAENVLPQLLQFASELLLKLLH